MNQAGKEINSKIDRIMNKKDYTCPTCFSKNAYRLDCIDCRERLKKPRFIPHLYTEKQLREDYDRIRAKHHPEELKKLKIQNRFY